MYMRLLQPYAPSQPLSAMCRMRSIVRGRGCLRSFARRSVARLHRAGRPAMSPTMEGCDSGDYVDGLDHRSRGVDTTHIESVSSLHFGGLL
jgi:hypothetical protein